MNNGNHPSDLDLPMPSPVQMPASVESGIEIDMNNLAEMIAEPPVPPVVPKIGLDASASIKACFDTLARDIENLGGDAVSRAIRLQQEAQSYASYIRKAGENLCGQMEDEATTSYQLSMVLRGVRRKLNLPPETGA